MNQSMWSVVSLGLVLSMGAAASDQVRVGVPSYGGSGCPVGSAQVSLTPDATQLSVEFERFTVRAGRSS